MADRQSDPQPHSGRGGHIPRVGGHNEDVLTGLIEYSEAEVQGMYESQVIGNFDHYDEVPG